MGNILQDEAYFYLNEYKDIVKTEDGYKLQPVFKRLQRNLARNPIGFSRWEEL